MTPRRDCRWFLAIGQSEKCLDAATQVLALSLGLVTLWYGCPGSHAHLGSSASDRLPVLEDREFHIRRADALTRILRCLMRQFAPPEPALAGKALGLGEPVELRSPCEAEVDVLVVDERLRFTADLAIADGMKPLRTERHTAKTGWGTAEVHLPESTEASPFFDGCPVGMSIPALRWWLQRHGSLNGDSAANELEMDRCQEHD